MYGAECHYKVTASPKCCSAATPQQPAEHKEMIQLENAVWMTSPAPTAKSNLWWSFGKQPSAQASSVQVRLRCMPSSVGRYITIHSDMPPLVHFLREEQGLKIFKITVWLRSSSFRLQGNLRFGNMVQVLPSFRQSEKCWGVLRILEVRSWAPLNHWRQPNTSPEKAGHIKATWDCPKNLTLLTAFEKLWPNCCLFSGCNHTSHKSGSQMIPHRKCQSGLTPRATFRHLFSFKTYANKVISGCYE